MCHNRRSMSRRKLTIDENIENSDFIERFIEVCGSSQPAQVSRLLNISYQAANNYLNGRFPDTKVLLAVSEQTPYSIHWLLTGKGKKIVGKARKEITPILTDEMKAFIRAICVEVVNQSAVVQKENSQTKTVILTSDNIKSEKVKNEITTLSD